jgi:hypothetical protein
LAKKACVFIKIGYINAMKRNTLTNSPTNAFNETEHDIDTTASTAPQRPEGWDESIEFDPYYEGTLYED